MKRTTYKKNRIKSKKTYKSSSLLLKLTYFTHIKVAIKKSTTRHSVKTKRPF